MIHYLLLKFEPGYFTDEIFQLALDTFTKLKAELPGVEDVSVTKNCIDRSDNADLLVTMKLCCEDMLDVYLKHPLHLHFVQIVNSHVIQRASIDEALV